MGLSNKAWLWTLLFGVFVAIFGFYLESRVARDLKAGLSDDLSTLRDTNVAAVLEWMHAQEQAVQLAVSEEGVAATALALIDASQATDPVVLGETPVAKRLTEQLHSTLANWEFEGYVVTTKGRIIASDDKRYVGKPIVDHEDSLFLARLRMGEPSMTRPQAVKFDDGSSSVMWVAASIRRDGRHQGAIAFRVDPSASFSRILQTARFGHSGETYAFDKKGILLSRSRFEEQLIDLGLLEKGKESALHLELLDPGIDLTKVDKRLAVKRGLQRTLAVSEATAGLTGANVDGYRDYRGIQVVGAWTWVPQYELGIVTELDQQEAFASTAAIRRATSGLLLVLIVLVCGMLIASLAYSRAQSQVERLGQYTLVRKIGQGGMGSVYEARHALLRRPTAIKMIRADQIDDRVKERFEREVQATAELTHPNTVAVYDYGQTKDGVFYYAMEFLSGATLNEVVHLAGPLPQERVIFILLQTLGSLSEAHAAGLVHRDIKPSNIMLCQRGGMFDQVKVLDFGLVKVESQARRESRLTAVNGITGTPHYMAPEAISDPQEVDARTDLYAVGAVGFFLLTGREVFPGPNSMTIMTRHLTEAPTRPSQLTGQEIAPELEDLVLSCLAKSPTNRPQTAQELIDRLIDLSHSHGLLWSHAAAAEWWRDHQDLLQPTTDLVISENSTVAVAGARNVPEESGESALGPEKSRVMGRHRPRSAG